MSFAQRITSEAELRSLFGEPSPLATNKVIHRLDDHCRDFIARSPFVLIATSGTDGTCDVSPRGDAPGFVRVLDEHRLAIPERPGNRRTDSLRNILANPQIGMIFLIPGLGETLRVNGRACITRDPELLASMAAHGKEPMVAIGVEVAEVFVHCAKALLRSKLWDPVTWPAQLPDTARMLADHVGRPDTDAAKVAASLQESYTKRLY
jgi:PPOX class probable FMN-dependent enzyme